MGAPSLYWLYVQSLSIDFVVRIYTIRSTSLRESVYESAP
jgi:hypothetical protein